MADKLIQAALLDGGPPADAFPLGGHVYRAAIAASAPSSLDGVLAGAASLLMIRIPAGRTLYVGHAAQVGSLTGDAARASMFPLDGGTWTLALADAGQVTLRLLGDQAFELRILAAATLDGSA